MSAQLCPCNPNAGAVRAPLPQKVASQIESLRQERLNAYAEQVRAARGPNAARTNLEQSVDELLDLLNVLHRLEQLAEYEAKGGRITIDADRLLVANHEDTYRKLLAVFTGRQVESAISTTLLL